MYRMPFDKWFEQVKEHAARMPHPIEDNRFLWHHRYAKGMTVEEAVLDDINGPDFTPEELAEIERELNEGKRD